MHPKEYYKELFHKWAANKIAEEEKGILFDWINQYASDQTLDTLLREVYEDPDSYQTAVPTDMEKRILKNVFKNKDSHYAKIITLKKWAVAASAILVLVLGVYLSASLFNRSQPQAVVASNETIDVTAPATNRAYISFSDGGTIYLDSLTKGEASSFHGVTIAKTEDDHIKYATAHLAPTQFNIQNTLYNPKGSKVITIQLSDGTLVWLNAGSSISYPVAFNNKQRKITINGEAYFDVVHDKNRPFIVSKAGVMNVEVLGTRFNVNAYDYEARVTLLEGSVKVRADNPKNVAQVLTPGQQAIINKAVVQLTKPVVAQETAWKEGYFSFNNSSLSSVLQQLSIWYNLEVVNSGNNNDRQFSGELPKNLSLKQILAILEESNINIKTDGKKLIVE